MNIYLLKYNSYFNRTIRKLATVQDYMPYVQESLQNINFKPNDGINTEQIVNTYVSADYFLTQEFDDSNNEIITRWFVMEQERTRNGQYRLTLKRDVVADFYEEVVNAPAFIEKATLPIDNPLIFNSEGMTFNQIKTSETLLKDKTKCGWIVGYIANNYQGSTINGEYSKEADISVATLSDWPFYEYTRGTGVMLQTKGITGRSFGIKTSVQSTRVNEEYITTNYAITSVTRFTGTGIPYATESEIPFFPELVRQISESSTDALTKTKDSRYFNNNYYYMPQFDGKILYDQSSSLYYIVGVEDLGEENIVYYVRESSGAVFQQLKNLIPQLTDGNYIRIIQKVRRYKITLTETVNPTANISITIPSGFMRLVDAPYSMFCIPYSEDMPAYINDGTTTKYMSSYMSKGIANAIANALQPSSVAGGYLFDLQLLPYCPIPNFIEYSDEVPGIDIRYMESGEYTEVLSQGATVGYIFWASRSSFDVTVNHQITVEEPKVSKECDKYRLVSPNHASISEFSPAMNGGVDFFHASCTYKPFTPYINVHPNYSGLYGGDFDDSRGLICGGDYSLPVMSDAWQAYQIQNKNYAAIFDREIENMEVNNKLQMVNQVGGAIAGTAQGALSGMMAGGVAGAVVGGVASGLGGIADTAMLGIQQAEAKDFKTDMYNYNLGNIQARPQGLAKSSGFDINNKIWPYLEYYTCTDKEKEAFRNKIRYNGMTVGIIGTISEYLWPEPTYIKAQIIRIETGEDTHLNQVIYEELAKGVYIS